MDLCCYRKQKIGILGFGIRGSVLEQCLDDTHSKAKSVVKGHDFGTESVLVPICTLFVFQVLLTSHIRSR